MAFKNFYTVANTINGKEYVAQFNGLNAALEAVDDCYIDGGQNISSAKLAKYILQKVIVQPAGLTPDDFDSLDELNEVIRWGRNVMQGKLKPSEDKKSVKSTDK